MQGLIVEQFDTHRTGLEKKIDMMINGVCDEYKRKIDGELLGRKRYMEQLEKNKKTNEELEEEISTLETEKKTIEDNIKMCVKIKGEL